MAAANASYYRRGADQGLPLGLVMATAAVCAAASWRHEGLGLAALAAMAAVPVLSAVQLRRSWLADGRLSPVGALWTQGVTAFACGSLVTGLCLWVYIGLIHPAFILEAVDAAREFYAANGGAEGAEIARRLGEMTDRGMLPTPVMLAVQTMMLATLAGSVWSLGVSAVLVLGGRRNRQTHN